VSDKAMSTVRIKGDLSIREDEIVFTAVRSAGPGGQNVNKVATKVTLTFDVAASRSLTDRQRALLRERLASRLTADGVLQLSSGRQRTQSANRREVLDRFVALLRDSLRTVRPRRPTKPTAGSVERRLSAKARRAHLKRLRRDSSTGEGG
jgi:ribosome-associated protein